MPGTQTGGCRQPGSPSRALHPHLCLRQAPRPTGPVATHGTPRPQTNRSLRGNLNSNNRLAWQKRDLEETNTLEQSNWLARGHQHPLCSGTGWKDKRPPAVTPSAGGHTRRNPGIRGQRRPPEDLVRNGCERSPCTPRPTRTENLTVAPGSQSPTPVERWGAWPRPSLDTRAPGSLGRPGKLAGLAEAPTLALPAGLQCRERPRNTSFQWRRRSGAAEGHTATRGPGTQAPRLPRPRTAHSPP